MTNLPADGFTVHLTHCTQGCDVRLDGTGPLCADGQRELDAVDWGARARAMNMVAALDGTRRGRANAAARRSAAA